MLRSQQNARLSSLTSSARCIQRLSRRRLSSSPAKRSYEDTIPNLMIGAHTRVMYQGFTGRVSTTNAQQSIEYGTNIVGGTTPGKEGEHLGLPLLPTVRAAVDKLKPNASAVFVAAQHAGKAIEDAIECEVPLIVAVAEFIPLHDMLRISQMLNTQSKSRVVGANCPGIISAIGRCRIGFQPLPSFAPGHIGVVAKSGTLSYEAVGSLTRAGLGQSVCIGMGGDIVAGTNLVDGLKAFEKDADTEGIVVLGEIGGRAELDAAEWIRDYYKRESNPKPILAAVGGHRAQPGRIMGHAGAFASLGEVTADVKAKALSDAGAVIVDHPSKAGEKMKELLKQSGRDVSRIQSTAAGSDQKRGYHTAPRLARTTRNGIHSSRAGAARSQFSAQQKRSLHFTAEQSMKMLKDKGIKVSETASQSSDGYYLAITVDRTNRCPAIMASPTTDANKVFQRAQTFDYDYKDGPSKDTVNAVLKQLQISGTSSVVSAVNKVLTTLVQTFKENEAYAMETHLSVTKDNEVTVDHAKFSFDNSAFKSAKRQKEIFALRDKSKEDADELSVEEDGIVYIKLEDPSANVGTLINGAGLAMNANDALTNLGARPTNFLDTGGKATKETVKQSFEVILKDARVKVIFVNIFGGITLCDMIAEGILLAFKDLEMKIPVVVRLRGTNEEEGQKLISESGLPLHAFDDFGEAARKCIEIANQS